MTARPIETYARPVELLLVEDNDEVGRTVEQMLHTSGLTVVRVTSADAALGRSGRRAAAMSCRDQAGVLLWCKTGRCP